MTTRRLLTAFAVAPAPLPLIVLILMLTEPWSFADATRIVGIFALSTYGAALLGGVPV